MFSRKVAILILTIFLISGSVNSQSFKIEDFIPIKFVDKQLRVNGRVGLSDQVSDNFYIDRANIYKRTNQNDRSSLGLNFETDYSYRYETIPVFFNFDLNAYSSFGINNNDYNNSDDFIDDTLINYYRDQEINSRQYSFSLRPKMSVGKYILEDIFISADFELSYNYSRNPKKEIKSDLYRTYQSGLYFNPDSKSYRTLVDNEDFDESSDYKSYYINFKLMPGLGRVYEGQFASTAIYMIDELRDRNLLLREPTKEDMIMLSDIIYQKRSEKFIDHRIHRIETFDKLLGFLRDNNLADLSGNIGYLAVADVWDYFPRDSRRFGYKFSLGAGIDYHYETRQRTSNGSEYELIYDNSYDFDDNLISSDTTRDDARIVHLYSHSVLESDEFYLSAKFEYFKPISRKWQFESNLTYFYIPNTTHKQDRYNVEYNYWNGGSSTIISSINDISEYIDQHKVYLNCYVNYYHDSRTEMALRGNFSYKSKSQWKGDVEASFRYRISIPTTLGVDLNYGITDYNWNENNNESANYNRRFSLNTTLTHYLF